MLVVVFIIMLTRSSDKIFDPMRYTGDNIYSVVFKMFQLLLIFFMSNT